MSITDCDSVYGPGNGHLDETGVLGCPYPYGECTAYCWYYYWDVHQVKLPGDLGNATDWIASAHRKQWDVQSGPGVDMICCWSAARYPPFGHVAVVSAVDDGGSSFWVREMNFTYHAAENPTLAGKIDCRHVTETLGIMGYITPAGVKVQGGLSFNPAASILDALSAPLTSIGDSIKMAGLTVQADAMTATSKLEAMGQVGAGLLLMGGGGTLAGLTIVGGGSPSKGVKAVASKVRRAKRAGATIPRKMTTAESLWQPKVRKP
jgi:surface antigen